MHVLDEWQNLRTCENEKYDLLPCGSSAWYITISALEMLGRELVSRTLGQRARSHGHGRTRRSLERFCAPRAVIVKVVKEAGGYLRPMSLNFVNVPVSSSNARRKSPITYSKQLDSILHRWIMHTPIEIISAIGLRHVA